MVKMVKLDRTASERRAEQGAGSEAGIISRDAKADDHDGPVLHLDHHHLKKMGMDAGKMKHGDPVEFHGRGHIEHASVDSGEHGDRHSARIRMTHGAAEHEGADDDERGEIRGAIEKAHGASLAKTKSGDKIAEK